MRYYFPVEDQAGEWHVGYLNHRHQICTVLGGLNQLTAIQEAGKMTINAFKEAVQHHA